MAKTRTGAVLEERILPDGPTGEVRVRFWADQLAAAGAWCSTEAAAKKDARALIDSEPEELDKKTLADLDESMEPVHYPGHHGFPENTVAAIRKAIDAL